MPRVVLALWCAALAAADAGTQVIAVDFGRRLPTSETGVMIDHAMAYDPWRARIVAWDAFRNPATIDEWDGARWTARALSSTVPPTYGLRGGHDPTTRTVLFFGGGSGGMPSNRQWRWNGATLVDDGAQVPVPARSGHQVCGTAHGVVMFGGDSGAGLLGDTWLWSGMSWTALPVGGPSPRRDHAMAYSYFEDAVYVFGGRDAAGPTNDLWRLDLSTRAWNVVAAASPPSPRTQAGLVEGYGGFLMLFGGVDARGRVLDEVHDFYRGFNAWQARGAVVDGHAGSAIARDFGRDEIVVHGGRVRGGASETWTADPGAIANFPAFARSVEFARGRTGFRISTDTNPMLGARFVVADRGVPSGAAVTVMAFGRAGDRNDPMGFHLDPAMIYAASGYASRVALTVPTLASLSGTEVVIQSVAVTGGGTSLSFSNSMRAVLGTW